MQMALCGQSLSKALKKHNCKSSKCQKTRIVEGDDLNCLTTHVCCALVSTF